MQVDEGGGYGLIRFRREDSWMRGGYGFRVHNDIMTLEGSEGVRMQ